MTLKLKGQNNGHFKDTKLRSVGEWIQSVDIWLHLLSNITYQQCIYELFKILKRQILRKPEFAYHK